LAQDVESGIDQVCVRRHDCGTSNRQNAITGGTSV
jgi:hypothetical protein